MKKNKIIKILSLAAYSLFILALVLNHEYWFDEAQAWNIARDNDIIGIFGMIKYEGHPPLWHLLLKLFITAGCSYTALGLVSWGISVLTAAIVIFGLPCKPYLKAALLLSGGMLYFNSAISRVYCLVHLLVTVIAFLYPKRKAHPIVYGITVALLTNTHVCISGFVGIIGVLMIIDLFKDFKGNTKKQNALNITGLAIGAFGVIAMIIPMLEAYSTNIYSSQKSFTLSSVASDFFGSFSSIIFDACGANLPTMIGYVLNPIMQILFIGAFIVIFKNRKCFVSELIFTVSYMILNGVVWYATPCRSVLFIYVFAIIFVMFKELKEEKNINAPPISEASAIKEKNKTKGKSLLSSINVFSTMNFNKVTAILVSVILIISTPSALVYAISDLKGEFDPAKSAALFIEKNISENALLVSDGDDYSALLAYLPGRKIFSLGYGRYYTYCSHQKKPENIDNTAFHTEAEKAEKIYYISSPAADFSQNALYQNNNYIPYDGFGNGIAVFEMREEDF